MDGVCSIPFSASCSQDDLPRSSPGHRRGKSTPRLQQAPLADFVAGPENAVAVEAVRGVLYGAAGEYSPLVFYGITGVGKTHLTTGLAELWRRRTSRPDNRNSVLSCSVDDFARRYAEAIETEAIDEWKRRLRQASLLVIDDIDRVAGKDAAQEELVRVIDQFASDHRQVIVTAKSPPERSKKLCTRLRSRLSAGLGVCIAPPGPAARESIIRQLCDLFDISLESATIKRLAQQATATYPQLRGTMLELRTSMRGDQVDEDALENVIHRRSAASTPALETIAASTAGYHGVTVSDLRSPSRRRQVVAARGVAMLLARELTDASYHRIGTYFGGRDHTTVMHGCRQTALRGEHDDLTKSALHELREQLSQG